MAQAAPMLLTSSCCCRNEFYGIGSTISGRSSSRSLGRKKPLVVQASLIPEPFKSFLRSVARTPAKFFLQQLDDEFDKAEDKFKKGAAMIKLAANTVEKLAETVDHASDKVEELVEKMEETVSKLDDELEELLESVEEEGDSSVPST